MLNFQTLSPLLLALSLPFCSAQAQLDERMASYAAAGASAAAGAYGGGYGGNSQAAAGSWAASAPAVSQAAGSWAPAASAQPSAAGSWAPSAPASAAGSWAPSAAGSWAPGASSGPGYSGVVSSGPGYSGVVSSGPGYSGVASAPAQPAYSQAAPPPQVSNAPSGPAGFPSTTLITASTTGFSTLSGFAQATGAAGLAREVGFGGIAVMGLGFLLV
ncbi:hypothetical protein LTR37_018566 [Vermiconidia calcicola]|uniref:Uncharacterized protein n=1 Tax=Vermiconidia calcicola TaxID=1690605 RepID=A0ACC3MGQ0_9PEZI|nr:hypothetical protein LTR37_018566 [Vermiconidia calcicola]